MRNVILPVGIAAALWYVISKATSVARLKFFIRGFAVRGTLFQPYFEIVLGAQNVGNVGATVTAITGELIYNNQSIANIEMFNPVTIAKSSETLIKVICRPAVIGIVATIVELIKTKQFPLMFEMRALINADGVVIPYTVKYTL